MNEQNKTPNTPPNTEENKENNIPSIAGIVIILALVGAFVFFFYRFQKDSQMKEMEKTISEPAPAVSIPSADVTDTSSQGVGLTIPELPAGASSSGSESSVAEPVVDLNYEVGKLDSVANSVSENDFKSDELKNSELSL
ncbi:MAG TPA: hypothetical protein PLK35_00810 [Candidatus Moranbacteria bacterium]|nr:hypothetical protein [Candidatus Moranbacteria bacterium]